MFRARASAASLSALIFALSCAVCARAQERTLAEYQVKALFIFNLVQFVEWPVDALKTPDAPFQIGVLGDNPFEDALAVAIKDEKVGGRTLSIVHGRTVEALKHCQLIFVSRSERLRVDAILAECAKWPVLTVGDTPGFAERGGILNFYLDGEKVRFEVNRAAAQRVKLKLSAQLLRLARLVGAKEGGKP